MRIVGVDPGTRKAGWGVVERRPDGRLYAVASGTLKLGDKRPLADRLLRLDSGLAQVFEQFEPSVLAIEDMFFGRYPNAAIKLGHARGVVMVAGTRRGLPVHEYPPALVKRTVAGRGNASKTQVAQLVGRLLRLKTIPGEDATDALAVAVTHLQATRMALAEARAKPPVRKRGKR